jgi:hypothetical protein
LECADIWFIPVQARYRSLREKDVAHMPLKLMRETRKNMIKYMRHAPDVRKKHKRITSAALSQSGIKIL